MKRTAVAGLTAVAVLAVPGVASAHKYTAYAGNPGRTPKSAPKSTELNQFFPQVMRVRKGDRVTYLNYAFHTVSVLGKTAPAPALALPDPSGAKYTGIQAPDGSSFFFNGLTKFVYNPAVFGPVGKPNVKDTGTRSSGAFGASDKGPGKYTLKFSRPGTYTVL